MGFPNKLTEEEEMLVAKYSLLRKKRKALQQARKNTKSVAPAPVQQPVKRTADTNQEEAREMAKKVMAAQAARQDNKGSGFKRSTNLEKRLKNPDKAPAFHPFKAPTANPSSSVEDNNSSSTPTEEKKSTIQKNLYDNFVSGGLRSEQNLHDNRRDKQGGYKRRRGSTVYVQGYGLSESLCRKALEPYGQLANVSVNDERKSAYFVTFGSIEQAEKAIEEVNGTMVDNITLKVHMAKRQPSIEPATNMKSPWTPLATGLSKRNHKDTRGLMQYSGDEDYFN